MTIYATPYDGETLQTTGLSTDSGFDTLDQVAQALGEPAIGDTRWLGYGEGGQMVAFSEFPFNLGPQLPY